MAVRIDLSAFTLDDLAALREMLRTKPGQRSPEREPRSISATI
jgi:hypothetical protein